MNNDYQMTGCIAAIQRYCLDDGPGIRTTVFLKGCPLRCQWCHNPETWKSGPECMQRTERCTGCGACISACPNQARTLDEKNNAIIDRDLCTACGSCANVCISKATEICGREMSVEEILAEVERDKLFYKSSGGGMTVSGGECAACPEFTLSLLRGAKERGIHTAMETSGFGSLDFFRNAAALGVLFLYDLKEIDAARHKSLTGVTNDLILQNLSMLMDLNAEIILRMPLIPGVNDSDSELSALADFLKSHKDEYRAAQIMPYHDLGTGKALALGRTLFAVDESLSADHCAACRDRWIKFFTERGLSVECE